MKRIAVALFLSAPGARWDDAVPQNTWHGYPVVDNIDGLRAAISALR